MISLNSSFCFVAKNTAYPELSKKVFKFFHTNKALSSFTTSTSTTRAFKYTIEDSDKANCSYFAHQLISMKETCDIVYPYSSDIHVLNKKSSFSMDNYPWAIAYSRISPFDEFKTGREDPVTYFQKIYNYANQWWND